MKKKQRTRIEFSFKGENQLPLFMVIKIWYDENGEVEFAKVLFQIKGREYRKILKELNSIEVKNDRS